MGTVNYMTSDYITLAARYDVDDFLKDPDFRAVYPAADVDFVLDVIREYYDDDAANVEEVLNRRRLWYYHIKIDQGYYEGFSIDIENNFGIMYDDCRERREAQKEITYIRAMLRELAGLGLRACRPGWCTSWSNYTETLKEIDAAIRQMREEVRQTPTAAQYYRDERRATA